MSQRPSATVLRLLTVNIHKGYSHFNRRYIVDDLRDAMRTAGTDLVFLQEVQGRSGPTPPQSEALADQVWPQHAYGRNAVTPSGDHGNALLSRFPIVHAQNHDVSVPEAEPRGLLHCVVDLPDQTLPLHAVCVHLGLRESHRRSQLDRLVALVQTVPPTAPVVVAGDFNDWRQRADARLRRAGLTEVFRQAHGTHARSFPARWPLLPLDRIYVRGVAASRPLPLPRSPWHALSDHAPLAAELVLRAAA